MKRQRGERGPETMSGNANLLIRVTGAVVTNKLRDCGPNRAQIILKPWCTKPADRPPSAFSGHGMMSISASISCGLSFSVPRNASIAKVLFPAKKPRAVEALSTKQSPIVAVVVNPAPRVRRPRSIGVVESRSGIKRRPREVHVIAALLSFVTQVKRNIGEFPRLFRNAHLAHQPRVFEGLLLQPIVAAGSAAVARAHVDFQ